MCVLKKTHFFGAPGKYCCPLEQEIINFPLLPFPRHHVNNYNNRSGRMPLASADLDRNENVRILLQQVLIEAMLMLAPPCNETITQGKQTVLLSPSPPAADCAQARGILGKGALLVAPNILMLAPPCNETITQGKETIFVVHWSTLGKDALFVAPT